MDAAGFSVGVAFSGPEQSTPEDLHLEAAPRLLAAPTREKKEYPAERVLTNPAQQDRVVDAYALRQALQDFESTGRGRAKTPTGSPSRKRQRIFGDRFIPHREGLDLQASFTLLPNDGSPSSPARPKRRPTNTELHFQKTEEANRVFSQLLRSELFDSSIPQHGPPPLSPEPTQPGSERASTAQDSARSRTPPASLPSPASAGKGNLPSTPVKNLFTYMSPRHQINVSGQPTPTRSPHRRHGPSLNPSSDLYSLSPLRVESQKLLLSPRKVPRAVSKVPFKVLDAPDLADDFYLNLVDWGSSNTLGVGLGTCVYMWNSGSGRVTKLCDLGDDIVTSVSWIQRGSHVAVGTNKGMVQIWDAERCRRLRTMMGHTARVGALAWNDHILTSGSRDRFIYHRDVRQPEQYMRKLGGHKQEVCGLRWNAEDGQLASGGNDNKLMIWDKLSETPLFKLGDHTAAVKAIAWSPHQHNLLASGGGTADRRIKFWNTATGNMVQEIDTGSQVCNLAWSKNSNEIVSTHGYSQNQIVVWKYPSMTQVASLTGHTYRVLYLAMSPDGQTVVTGAGDETLRFWKCFGKKDKDGVMGDGGGSRMERWGVIR